VGRPALVAAASAGRSPVGAVSRGAFEGRREPLGQHRGQQPESGLAGCRCWAHERHSVGERFGLCDCLQEPRQCGEVTEDGEPNAIPVDSASNRRRLLGSARLPADTALRRLLPAGCSRGALA
jgi:hypothetical protein